MKVEGLLLDVEGVLVADKRYQAVEGAVEFVRQMRQRNIPMRLITNNTTDSRRTLAEKLAGAGYDFTLDELHTCTAAAARRLRDLGARKCMVLGTPALRAVFADEGFDTPEDSAVDAIIIGLDTDLTYDRLRLACEAITGRNAAFIALHRNRVYTDAQGRVAPSVGAIVEAVRFATRAEPTVIGKPSPDYYQQVLNTTGLAAHQVMVVSDDPLTDLAGAKRMGMHAAFVLSGKYDDPAVTDQLPPDQRPDLVCDRIGDLLSAEEIQL